MDLMLTYGGAVKALGNGRLGGYLITFGGLQDADNSRYADFFTPQTDYAVDEWPAKTAVYYHHGLDKTVGKRRLGVGEMKADEVGIWIETQLALRDEWEEAIYALAEAKRLSWSSGSATHLTERHPVKSAAGVTIAHELKSWPLGLDASLTPTPADARCDVVALKSVDVPTLAEMRAGKTPVAAKGLLGDYLPQQMTMAALRTLNDALFYSVLYDLIWDPKEERDAAEKLTLLRQAFDEFRDVAVSTVEALLAVPEDGAAVKAALKALWRPAPVEGKRSLAERTEQVTDDLGDLLAGYRQVKGAELKVGRALSAARRERLQQAQQLISDLLAETAPDTGAESDTSGPGMVAADEAQKALRAPALRRELEALQLRCQALLITGRRYDQA